MSFAVGVLRRVLLLPLLCLSFTVYAQETTAQPSAAEIDNAVLQGRMEERLQGLEQRAQEQAELSLGRLETVEGRIEGVDRHISQVLLIFGLAAVMIFFLMISSLRAQQRLSAEQVSRTVREAQGLMDDIRQELSRPEMEYLRVGHMLRKIMRRLRESGDAMTMEETGYARTVGDDGHLPASLYFMARALTAECDGQWHEAVKMLDELRSTSPEDADVLLHLSHVHTHIAENVVDAKVRKRHQDLSQQYYVRFAMMVQVKGKALPAKEKADLASSVAALEEAKQVEAAVAMPKTPDARPAAPSVAALEEAKQVEAAAAMPKPTALTVPEKPPTVRAVIPTPDKLHRRSEPKKANKLGVILPAKLKIIIPKVDLGKVAGGLSQRISQGTSSSMVGLRTILHTLKREEDIDLPFVPAPRVSEIPPTATGANRSMWQEVRQGDLSMVRAAISKTMRQRNRQIDTSISYYAQAQSYESNEILYQNWGRALLAKALHLPEKKRAPLFNAAVDKFMAGNVVRRNYFDFSLAMLYAIMDDSEECKKWLGKASNSDTLDVDALRHAPDFDGVRNEPWFAEFLRE